MAMPSARIPIVQAHHTSIFSALAVLAVLAACVGRSILHETPRHALRQPRERGRNRKFLLSPGRALHVGRYAVRLGFCLFIVKDVASRELQSREVVHHTRSRGRPDV